MRLCSLLVGIFAIGLVRADSLGAFRKRFSGNPAPGVDTPEQYYRTGLDVNQGPAPADCCKPVYTNTFRAEPYPVSSQGYHPSSQAYPPRQDPVPQPPQTQPPRPGGGGTPNIPPPVRPTLYFQAESYRVYDRHHGRDLALFDPENWVRAYPGQPFPAELDVPNRWYVYNAVTVQAPKPYVDERALRERIYTGYYYACPERVSPYKFSWMQKNDPVNPCKWIFYQSLKDAGRPIQYN